MSYLLDLSKHFLKLAQIEKEPETERRPHFKDERLQAYELMSLLNSLAHLKNQLYKIKDAHSLFGMVFNMLVRLRPGTIKNAIQGMMESDMFDLEAYSDLKNAVFKDIEDSNLANILDELVQIIDVELLYDEDLAKSEAGLAMKRVRDSATKAIKAISSGLQYL